TQLSELGRLLLASNRDNKITFRDSLIDAERKTNLMLESLYRGTQTLIIFASDSEKLEYLRQQNLNIELHTDGSGPALSAYAEGKCEIAGFHIGLGTHNKKQVDAYLQHLDSKHDQFITLEHRQQGLISHPDRPVISLQQIIEQDLTFVNRQQNSGTRNLLNQLLQEQNIQPEQLNGYYHEEHTHLAVASMVSSRQADVGLGIHSAAERLKLQFTPISNELYFLVFKSLTPAVQQVLDKLSDQSKLEIINYKQFTQLISVEG
ncbi:MAG: substrate-binding domain-containing protein, partial [Methylococcales bacterium]